MKKIIFINFALILLIILSTCRNEPLAPLIKNARNTIDNTGIKDSDKTDNQVTGHVIAKYSLRMWSYCPEFTVIYEKVNKLYTKTTICNQYNTTNQMDISKDEFNQIIYISHFLKGNNDFIEVSTDVFNDPNLPPEIDKCIQHTNKATLVGYNSLSGIIIRHYYNGSILGQYDVWSYRTLISFTNIAE